ncbi:metal-dependent hydrolase [Marinobacterium aestuariivivens]|uniref:Metal-dependent hydrolase n=1 Tax=Marinobacterium aestuariivivens TaxID=1698799 RepID=A0ABW2A8V0_9GAMM
MADFKTHTVTAAVISAGLSVAALVTGLAELREALLYCLAGTLGGLLPDIDADESIAIRLVFRLFGALVAGLVLMHWMTTLPLWQVLGLSALGFLAVRYPLMWLFAQYTVHRGLLHSLLANLLFAAAALWLGYGLFGLEARVAWGVGGFVFAGATLHLLLDELYSVDLSGMRIKRSFGSALKLTDWGQPLPSLLLLLGCAGLFWMAPASGAGCRSSTISGKRACRPALFSPGCSGGSQTCSST